jgi:hypothetical protein
MAQAVIAALLEALRDVVTEPNTVELLELRNILGLLDQAHVQYPDEAVAQFVFAIRQASGTLAASVAVPAAGAGAFPTVTAGTIPAPTPAAAGQQLQTAQLACDQCDRTFLTGRALAQHITDEHTGTVCHWPGCGSVTTEGAGLRAHLRSHQRAVIQQGGSPLMCHWPGCDCTVRRADSAVRHLLGHNSRARGDLEFQR